MFTELNEFAEMVKKELIKMVSGCDVMINDVTKNNGVMLKGITIRKAGEHISPQIYLNDFYREYRNGRELKNICVQIQDIYDREKNNTINNMHLPQITDFETIKDHIVFRIVNKERNQVQLQDMPYREFLDLAIIYCIALNMNNGDGTVKISNDFLNRWGVDEQTLYEIALKNTPLYSEGVIAPMATIVSELLKETNLLDDENEEADIDWEEIGCMMYVATNSKKIHGAAVILYPGLLQEASERLGYSSLYLLPSSVHEFIILKADKATEPSELVQMVRDINSTEVQPEEVLSDNVYFYDADNGKLCVITE